MKQFFLSLWPQHAPVHMKKQGDLQIMRERILHTLLLLIGAVSFLLFLGLTFSHPDEILNTSTAANIAFVIVVFAFVAYRRMPYPLRASLVLLTLLVVVLYTYITSGYYGNGRLWLIALNLLTMVFLGFRAGIIGLALTHAGTAIFGFLATNNGIFVPPGAITGGAINFSWLRDWFILATLSTLATMSVGILNLGLERTLKQTAQLAQDLEKERSGLQERIEKRTETLQRRRMQITTASEISRGIFSMAEPQSLLSYVANQIRDQFNLYYVGIFLVDERNYAVLKAGTGEAGEKMLAAHHQLKIGGASMIGWAIANRQTRIAQDIGSDAVRFNNPYLPKTRSEIAIPILSQSTPLGAITIQSDQPSAFDEEDVQILQGIADSLAIALENARLMKQSQDAIQELQSLNQRIVRREWTLATKELGKLTYVHENNEVPPIDSPNIVHIPISLRGQLIGQIEVEAADSMLSDDQAELIDAITNQTALALENARLLEESQQRTTQEIALNQLSTEFSSAFTIDDVLQTTLNQLCSLPAVSEIVVQLKQPATVRKTSNQNGNGHHPKNGQEGAS